MKNKIALLVLAIVNILILGSCKKKSENDPQPSTMKQSASLKITPVSGNNSLNFDSVYTTNSGQKYTVSTFRYYLSNIRLVKEDGSEYPISEKYFLVNPSTSDYDLGQVPVGNYRGIRFSVGIDSLTNHKDPTTYPENDPLAIQSPGMHWSWNSGYIFMMIEGSCDTTANNSDVLNYGQYSHGMFFHIGMDPLYRNVDLISTFTVGTDNAKTIALKADINTFFNNIDLKTQNKSHSMGSMSLATTAADNIPNMFSIIK
ncbi:MAG TPA: MbnP family protein, partial [Cytophagaceae bacterium]|jgi:hypothetical protein|nr:MbnP family protein [Cytophagaceae bacterium]